ncbi:MAG: transposase [Pseudonocardiales bacterium]|nr:transposase [Pseudonocardiales bacterium]
MGSTRQKFTAEYKAEAVELVINSGRSIPEIARDLGINGGTLGVTGQLIEWRVIRDGPRRA